jgi:hypothetical protein
MRTKSLCLAAAVLTGGILAASAQGNVYSLNVVGYVNTVFKGNSSYTLAANPLNAATNDLNTVLSAALPNKSSVTTYDGVNYTTYTKAGGVWPVASIPPGTGFFVRNLATSDITNTFVGEVLGGLPGTNTTALPAGYSLVGSKAPIGGDINGAGPGTLNLSAALPNKASVTVYDNTTPPGTYTTLTKAGGAFPATPIAVGQGFYVRALTAGSNWVQILTNAP